MDEKLVAGLLERLDALTSKLGIAGEALWHVFVRQAVIASWIDVGVFVAIVIGWFVIWKAAQRATKIGDEEMQSVAFGVLLFMGLGLALATGIAITSISSIVTGIVNPEYSAFQKLVGHK